MKFLKNPFFLLLALIYLIPVQWFAYNERPVRLFDEATYANNSIDFYQEFSPAFQIRDQGKPDAYNNKPPLVLWMQAAGFHLFGLNETGLRFPTAFAMWALALVLAGFLFSLFKNIYLAGLGGFLLLTCDGVMRNHVGLTGDLDGLLLLFTTTAVLAGIQWMVRGSKKKIWPILVFLFLGLGFLAKGSAVLIPILGFALAILIFQRKRILSHWKSLILLGLSLMLVIFTIGWLMNSANPGYAESVLSNNLSRLFTPVMTWHIQPWWFYLKALAFQLFTHELVLLCLFLPLGFRFLKPIEKSVFLILLTTALLTLIGLSLVQVKLNWYDASVYPLLLVCLVMVGYRGIMFFMGRFSLKRAPLFSVIVLFLVSLPGMIGHIHNLMEMNKEVHPQHATGVVIREQAGSWAKTFGKIQLIKEVAHPEHLDQVRFYLRAAEIEHGLGFELVSTEEVEVGDMVFIDQGEIFNGLKKHFYLEIVDHKNTDIKLLQVQGMR